MGWRRQNAVGSEWEVRWCFGWVAVGRAVVGCLREVDNQLGHGSVCNEWAVESEEEALDGVELR